VQGVGVEVQGWGGAVLQIVAAASDVAGLESDGKRADARCCADVDFFLSLFLLAL